jgi:hypothetical protein
VARTLPKWLQVAYRIVMGSIILTPAQGARASLYAATRTEALAAPGLGPYFTSECAARAGAYIRSGFSSTWALLSTV